MRALNSGRPRPTSVYYLATRPAIFLVLLLLLVHGVKTRSLPRDGEVEQSNLGIAEDGVKAGGIEKNEEKAEEKKIEAERIKTEGIADVAGETLRQDDEEGNVAKKRRRNDVALSGKSDLRNTEENFERVKDEGIRRFDAQVEGEAEESGMDKVTEIFRKGFSDRRNVQDADKDASNSEVVNRKRLIDVEQSGQDAKEINVKSGIQSESNDGEEAASVVKDRLEKVRNEQDTDVIDQEHQAELEKIIAAEKAIVGVNEQEKSSIENTEAANEEVQNDLRSLGSIGSEESNQGVDVNRSPEEIQDPVIAREDRQLEGSKHKTSTVYLNAEEGQAPEGVQKSIVDGQIKKLISIRDDALGSVNDPAEDNLEQVDETKVLGSKKNIEIENDAPSDDVRHQRSSSNIEESSEAESTSNLASPNIEDLEKLKGEAELLQDQVRNRTFLEDLKEKALLPGFPKFTEVQLLINLKKILLSRKSELSNISYSDILDMTVLSARQLEIIKCAEQVLEVRQRQSFITSMADCIRGLSVLNCMRVLIGPIVINNLPEFISQNLLNLPIEINVIDFFQGNTQKPARSQETARQLRFVTPETILSSILTHAHGTYLDDTKSFIDPKNETLQRLLTSEQLQILTQGEKLLPHPVRQEYSDKMFSCVRRFEYLSCVKYFAWPMIKQYYPALPAFPDYQNWYPTVSLYPNYPIVPFPTFSNEMVELPEVIDADATRIQKTKPETIIIHVLQDTLKQYPQLPRLPSVIDPTTNSLVTLIPREQLASIQMAEQFLPIGYRPEFVDNTMKCIRQYNYLTCFKYYSWPTMRQLFPGLPEFPDISGWIPDIGLPQIPDVFGYLPELPTLASLGEYFTLPSGLFGAQSTPTPAPAPTPVPADGFIRTRIDSSTSSDLLEFKITEILKRVQKSQNPSDLVPLSYNANVFLSKALTERQAHIIRLAENIVSPDVRPVYLTEFVACLIIRNDFANCTKSVTWPYVCLYVPDLPEFPQLEDKENLQELLQPQQLNSPNIAQERINSGSIQGNINIISRTSSIEEPTSRTKSQQNAPVISVTDTRFVPIFTEHPETVILNILRSVQQSSPSIVEQPPVSVIKSQQFLDYLNQQQENIIRLTETLLPDSIRPEFVNRMISCVRENNFLICTRDVIWPTLTEYFPRLPSFPNFGFLTNTVNRNDTTAGSRPVNLTETSTNANSPPLSETNVKTGQHGDATVTITETRFYPIFSEHPENVILNILRAVQLSTPNILNQNLNSNRQDLRAYFTERQVSIVQAAEALLPENRRPMFLEKMVTCIKSTRFTDCTRDVVWPTVIGYFPRLPSFPNFGIQQNLARTKLQSASNLGDSSSAQEINALDVEKIETEIESILKKTLENESTPRVQQSYLDISNPLISGIITDRQASIIRLAERAIPDPVRPTFVMRMLECIKSSNFISCTQHVTWPTLKQLYPNIPDIPDFGDYLPSFPSQIPQLPDQITQFPGSIQVIPFPGQFQGFPQYPNLGQFPGIPDSLTGELPGIPQIPGGIPQIPGGIPQIPGGISQLPVEYPQIPNFPQNLGPSQAIKSFQAQEHPSSAHPEVLASTTTRPEENNEATSTITPLVGNQGTVPPYIGQPSGILLDVSSEKVDISNDQEKESLSATVKPEVPSNILNRKRRGVVDLLTSNRYDVKTEKVSRPMDAPFPNITESEFLQLLVNVSKSKNLSITRPSTKEYYVDTVNVTVRNALTADQYEILKIVEDLHAGSNRSFLSRVVQCIQSLSFIRCMGIFVWPVISSNLPSLPSFPSLPSIPGFGRSAETEVEQFFGMSSLEFEKELLIRKESIENFLVNSYKKLVEDKFQKNYGFLKVRGFGNGELSISFSGSREGRASKIKDNKNLPSILTIISDIMEEVLDQRPEAEKPKRDKEKRERSIDNNVEYQVLKDNKEEADMKRSITDEQIITMFLDKIKANDSDFLEEDVKQYVNVEDAYNAFEVLFGTRLNDGIADKIKTYSPDQLRSFVDEKFEDPNKKINIIPLESRSKGPEQIKVTPLNSQVTYDLEKESLEDQKEKNRQRTKNAFKSFLDKYSDKYLQETRVEKAEEGKNKEAENSIKNNGTEENKQTELMIHLPKLSEDIIPKKITTAMINIGRTIKTNMPQMAPGVGWIISFLIQMVLTHARAAASVASTLSNMALGSAMFGMVRQTLFGPNNNAKIKYVYDNDKTGPGISWPSNHMYGPAYGK